MTESVVESYFRAHQSSLYLWTEDGHGVFWLDGTTIAFHEEVNAVIERLAYGSLPSLSSVIVALAATRNSWPEVSDKLTRLVRALSESELPTYSAAMKKHLYLTDTWPATRRRLTGLSQYAASKVTTVADRAELLATLFDGFESSLDQTQQLEIAAAFQAGLPEDWFFARRGDGESFSLPSTDEEEAEWRRRPPIFHRILHDVLEFLRVAKVLASNLHDWDQDNLQQRRQTGVAFDIQPPESPIEEPLQARELLSSLQEDAELGGFARLARSLVAAISLPRSLETAQDIPAGGVSDISNRGQLDQLLLTELAFDDLALAIRIATNEAMYVRRESPLNPDLQCRPVLIDISLPMWGIPKLYATAMAMALSAVETETLTVQCFRPEAAGVVPVSLASREDINQQLATLSPTEHPGLAVSAFQDAVGALGEPAEPVIISTTDVWESPTFQHMLSQTNFTALWVILVERDGRLQLLQRTRQGTSIRKKIHLPVEEILRSQDAESLVRQGVPEDLPNILRLDEFPLRLFAVITEGRVFRWGDQAVSFTTDGRFLLWDTPRLGAVQLLDNLATRSRKPPTLVARDESMIQFYVPTSPPSLVTVHRPGMQVEIVRLIPEVHDGTPLAAVGPTLFLRRRRPNLIDDIMAIDRSTGQQLATGPSPETDDGGRIGRIFRIAERFAVLYLDGTRLVYEPLPKEFWSACDVLEIDAGQYICISADFQLQNPGGPIGLEKSHAPAFKFTAHLPGSDMFQVSGSGSTKTMWQTSGKRVPSNPASCERQEWMACSATMATRTPHWKFRKIALEPTTGRIRLQSNKGLEYVIRWNHVAERVELARGGKHNVVQLSEFVSTPAAEDVGYRLKLAEWEGGNKAWLDSRGLLHLKSGDCQVPQITLVLQDGQLSGWLSTGETFGEDYFVRNSVTDSRQANVRVTNAEAWKQCITPFLNSGPWNFHYSFDTASTGTTTLPHY